MSNGTNMVNFKNGAFLPGQPVQPVVLEFPDWIDVLTCKVTGKNRQKRGNGYYAFAMDTTFLGNLFYMLTVPFTPCVITYLPVYYPNEEEKSNASLYADNVRKVMSENSRLGTVEAGRLDSKLVGHVLSNWKQVPTDVTDELLGAGELEMEFGPKLVNFEKVKMILDEFLEGSDDHGGIKWTEACLNGEILGFKAYLRKRLIEGVAPN